MAGGERKMPEGKPDISGAIKGRLNEFLRKYPDTKGQKPVSPVAPLLGRERQPLQTTRYGGRRTK